MSNKQTPSNGHYSVGKYLKEAEGGPFVLDVDVDTSITVPRPSGDQMLDAEAEMRRGNSRGVIQYLCGDVAKELLDVIGPMDAAVLKGVSEDMGKHFGLGE